MVSTAPQWRRRPHDLSRRDRTSRPSRSQIYLIRHGETEWSLSGQHTGRTDIPLTAHGEDEARELAPSLRGIAFSRVLTSPRQRARQTAELTGLGAAAEIEPDLAEWDYGDYEGIRSVDIRKQRPDWNVFQDGCPNGETPDQVAARADRLIRHLCTFEGNVALFSHGQFGCSLAVPLDRAGGHRSPALLAGNGLTQCPWLRCRPSQTTGHRKVEHGPEDTLPRVVRSGSGAVVPGFTVDNGALGGRVVQAKHPGRTADELAELTVDAQGDRRRRTIAPADRERVAGQPQIE